MKQTILTIIAALLVSTSAMAQFKVQTLGKASKLGKLTESQVTELFNGTQPVCVKDGGSMITFNDAFRDAGFKYRDCSQGDAAVAKHKALGVSVTVIKVAELPDSIIRSLYGKE